MIPSFDNSAIAAFCRELREARRFQQVTLDEVAQATRVSIEYLEALEMGRWDEVPRAYLRGYLGLYAHAVGMNREKVIRTFDQLISPILNVTNATLDETPPLLAQPEHVEVTRVKIRAAWFAALSRNRKAIYLLTFLLLIALLGSLYLSRRVRNDSIQQIPFSLSFKENSTQVHSPMTDIYLLPDSARMDRSISGGYWVRLIGNQRGSVIYDRSDTKVSVLSFAAYDTINIEYDHNITLKIHPIQSALCYIGDSLIHADTLLTGDSEFYRISSRKDEKQVPQIAQDSLQ
ncbi:helix-turn-helix domain-containing protein [candidate division KSB1 bacterium]|nr:MAG: helix-turn-helix domain-containing protein [candidate division KSB1 bacterium]